MVLSCQGFNCWILKGKKIKRCSVLTFLSLSTVNLCLVSFCCLLSHATACTIYHNAICLSTLFLKKFLFFFEGTKSCHFSTAIYKNRYMEVILPIILVNTFTLLNADRTELSAISLLIESARGAPDITSATA